MKRPLALAAVAMFALTSVALADNNGAKVYRAKLEPIGTSTVTGKSHLVDGKKNNFVTVHAKGLTTGTDYEWHIHEFATGVTNPCAQGATQGPIVTAFTYGDLIGNEAGSGSAKGKSTTFNADPAKQYYVNIHAAPGIGTPISCGVLIRNVPKPHPQGKQRGFERH
jgi:hypothetical protein